MFLRYKLARYITVWFRARMLRPYFNQNGTRPFIMFLPSYRIHPPYPGWRRYRALESQKRTLEALQVDSMKELYELDFDEEEVNPHSNRIAKVNSMSEARQLACEGVKIDSEFFKGSFPVVSTFYKVHLKRVHYLETKENRPVEYFNLSCFVDPKNEIVDVNQHQSEAINFDHENLKNDYLNQIFETFNVASINLPEALSKIPEMSNDGSNLEGTAVTTIPVSSPHSSTASTSQGVHFIGESEEEQIFENSN